VTDAGNNGAGEPDTGAALAMLSAFESVGATAFDVTLTNIEGVKAAVDGFSRNRSLGELRRSVGARLEAATRLQVNFIIRPRSSTATLIQLDDIDAEKAAQIAPHAFMVLRTSPGNFQAWVAVKDSTPDFPLLLKRGTGADPTASGATRISGSLNFKTRYAPTFPLVELDQVNPGNVTTTAALESAGFVARAEEQPRPPAGVPPRISPPHPAIARKWPDYQQTLRGAPLKRDGSGPDRSLADFMWCRWAVERGWSIEATAEKLAEVSEKAQERVSLKRDEGYPLVTARNAAAAVERERRPRQLLKSAQNPRR
jgi:DNA primase RepB-like protein